MAAKRQRVGLADSWRRLRRNPLAMAGFLTIAFLFVVSLLAPVLANNKPIYLKKDGKTYFPIFFRYPEFTALTNFKTMQAETKIMPPVPWAFDEADEDIMDNPSKPSRTHLMGTDGIGRDLLSRVIHGTGVSLKVGFTSVTISVFIGVLVGALSGFYGGWVDIVFSRVIEVMQCFPTFFLILTVIALVGPSIKMVMFVIGFTTWTGLARMVRGEFLSLRDREFVLAARVLGASDARIIFRHVLPNALAPVFVSATLGVASAILTESTLSYLGMGVQPPDASWGNLISDGQQYIRSCWWLSIYPGTMILITVLSYNLFGEGLRDALDPRMR